VLAIVAGILSEAAWIAFSENVTEPLDWYGRFLMVKLEL